MTPDSGNYVLSGTEGTWTGEASSVVFTNGEAAARFTQVKVVYEGTGSETVGTYTPTIAFASSALSIAAGQSTDNAATTNSPVAVVYSSSNDAVATVSDKGKITAVAEGTATITASVAAVGGTCTKINGASATSTVTVTAPVAGQFAFDFTDKTKYGLDQWPAKAAEASSTQTYTLGGTDYTFDLGKDTYMSTYNNASYLMVKSGSYLGLPAIAGKKLVKVQYTTSSGASTGAFGAICTDTAGANAVTGGDAIALNATSTEFTFTLTGTAANTMYYFVASKKNSQTVKIVLTYE
ncbi:MAG: Ig-like domain-containing protein [Bacteroidales bacterium]|nr:Ig-like domain-containing protein [Bacteroidales bacterium]